MKKGEVFEFTLDVVDVGQNRHGEMVTTCIVLPTGQGIAPPGATGTKRLTGHNKRAFEILTDLLAAEGRPGDHGVPSGTRSVPEKWWRERFYERAMPAAEQKTKEKTFRRAADALVEMHKVGLESGRIWVVHTPRFSAEPQQDTDEETNGGFCGDMA